MRLPAHAVDLGHRDYPSASQGSQTRKTKAFAIICCVPATACNVAICVIADVRKVNQSCDFDADGTSDVGGSVSGSPSPCSCCCEYWSQPSSARTPLFRTSLMSVASGWVYVWADAPQTESLQLGVPAFPPCFACPFDILLCTRCGCRLGAARIAHIY